MSLLEAKASLLAVYDMARMLLITVCTAGLQLKDSTPLKLQGIEIQDLIFPVGPYRIQACPACRPDAFPTRPSEALEQLH